MADTNPLLNVVKGELNKLLHHGTAEMGKVTCEVCKIIVGTIQRLYDTHTGWDEIAKLVGDVCYWFKIEDEHVCKAIAQEFKVREGFEGTDCLVMLIVFVFVFNRTRFSL